MLLLLSFRLCRCGRQERQWLQGSLEGASLRGVVVQVPGFSLAFRLPLLSQLLLSRAVQESWNLHLQDQFACRGPRGVGLTPTDDLRE